MRARLNGGAPAAPSRRRARGRGVSLVELVVAVLILSVGVVAALRALEAAGRASTGLSARFLAEQVALNRAAEARLFGLDFARGLPPEVEMGGRRFRIEIVELPTRGGLVEAELRVAAEGEGGVRLVAHLRPEGR